MNEIALRQMQDLLQTGVALLGEGRLSEAEGVFLQILQRQPQHFDALHLLGILALQTGQIRRGVDLITKAIEINRESASAHANLGNGLRELKQPQAALDHYDRAIALNPTYAGAHSNRGNVLIDLNRPEEALASYNVAIELKPDYADAYSNRGNALIGLARVEEALASCDKAIVLRPDHAEAYNNRGNALTALKRAEDALVSYNRAIALRPNFPEAYSNRANALTDLGRAEEAIASCGRAVALRSNYAEAHNNCGNAFRELQRFADALASYERAIAISPNYAEAHSNRANALIDLRRPEEALASSDIAIRLKPDFAEAYSNRGNALRDLNRLGEALVSHDKAIALKPEYADAYWNKSLVCLLMGDFEKGLELYERRKMPKTSMEICSSPRWLGQQSIAGKTLLIFWEQGLGDTIQFCRYAMVADAIGAKVILLVQDALARLLKELSPTIEILDSRSPIPHCDYQIPLLSMPLSFKTNESSIPCAIPYLRAEPDRIKLWREKLGPDGYKIGICWQGSKALDSYIGRSLPLRYFEVLSNIPGVRLICLQKNSGTILSGDPDSGIKLELLGEDFDASADAFIDCAAVMQIVDLVITADTAIAHLAGALGRPTWVALKHVPDWRWCLDRSSTPWYPTMRLFRQPSRGDWASVFASMEIRIRECIASK